MSEYERILANVATWEVHEGSKEAKKEGPRRPDID